MKNKELIKLMQSEFDVGESLQNIFEKYKSEDIKTKKLAYFVGTLKDKALIKKHIIANNILIVLMGLFTILAALSGYAMGLEVTPNTPIYWVAVAIIPMIFLYGFIKHNYPTYVAYSMLIITQLPKSFHNVGGDIVPNIIGLLISLSTIIFVWYLKSKLFPYMGFLGPKKNADKQYFIFLN